MVVPLILRSVELIDLVPNSLSFRVISTIDIESEAEIPTTFTGRVRYHENGKVAYVKVQEIKVAREDKDILAALAKLS